MDTAFDVAVVGGGAAGLSAALVLGRARRRVVVIDAAKAHIANPRAQVITAAGEGSAAAIALDADLVQEDVRRALDEASTDRR